MKTADVLNEYLDDCRRRELKDKTLDGYKWAIAKLVKHCPEMPTESRQIAPVYDDPKLGRVSKDNLERAIKAFLNWAEEMVGHSNPLRGVRGRKKTKTLPRFLNKDETSALWDACNNQQEQAMVSLLLDTGIRLGELTALTWTDIKEDSLTVDGKTGPRVVPVTSRARRLLDCLGDGTHLWTGKADKPMSRAAVQSSIRRIFRRAKIKGQKIGPHVLRHTFAVNYLQNGGSTAHLQKVLGHASITTTQVYADLAITMVKEVHEKYSPSSQMLLPARTPQQSKVDDLLRDTRELVADGWSFGMTARLADGSWCHHLSSDVNTLCLSAAFGRAWTFGKYTRQEVSEARERVVGQMHLDRKFPSPTAAMIYYNDADGRRKAEVLELLDRAIASG